MEQGISPVSLNDNIKKVFHQLINSLAEVAVCTE